MGQKQSKDELVYQQVSYGNSDGIRSLFREGAGLEWMDREGKTPLILASMNLEHYNVAKTLIDLGANINAYRPGRSGGTPLHHAAKRGLEQTVKLLLSHGANALVMNDDCQTPLEVARAKGYTNVVRAIEGHLCLFSGLLREFYGPGFLEVLAPQFVTRKVWVVVLPTGSRNAREPFKLELAIYPSSQVAQPRTVISLWKANLEDPKLQQADPSITIVDNSNMPRGRRRRRMRHRPPTVRQTRIRLAAAKEGDRQQLQWFCDACKGIPQAAHPPQFLRSSHPPDSQPQATAPLLVDDLELAVAMSASFQSDINVTHGLDVNASSEASASTSSNDFMKASTHGPVVSAAQPATGASSSRSQGNSNNAKHQADPLNSNLPDVSTAPQATSSVPSAPPIVEEIVEDGPIQYPRIDFEPVIMASAPMEESPVKQGEKKEDGGSSVCVICLDAPVEGACVPCGHMAGCMSCLTEIKTKKWGCPVCRTKIDQIIRLYAV
ncbi:Putative E3 ubiquitin-protein ligase XBAT35 [Linum grandiflorum]